MASNGLPIYIYAEWISRLLLFLIFGGWYFIIQIALEYNLSKQ